MGDLIAFVYFVREVGYEELFLSSDSKKGVREMAHRGVNYYARKESCRFRIGPNWFPPIFSPEMQTFDNGVKNIQP
jgi:hypothetical protein